MKQPPYMPLREKMMAWARRIKLDVITLWFACKHPETPLTAKALCIFVVGYALSPIDLIPDFIPVLGYIDDVLLLPGLIWLAIQLVPSGVLQECRQLGQDWFARGADKPRSYWAAALIMAAWIGFTWWLWVAVVAPALVLDSAQAR
jgi:uncharacterized membrane protein YkvA (DUF1232 family)